MSEAKHTPGPWKWLSVDGGWDAIAEEAYPKSLICKLVLNVGANARLISAAPELLSALQLVRRNSLRADWPHDINEAIDGAIAKATGECCP